MITRCLAIVLLVGSALTCARRSPVVTAVGASGCYAFQRTDGASPPLGQLLPDTVRLETAANLNPDGAPHPDYPLTLEIRSHRRGNEDGRYRDFPEWRQRYSLAAWRSGPRDSVTVLYHANMSSGWLLRLRTHGDSLVGQADIRSDDGAADVIPLVARRITCK